MNESGIDIVERFRLNGSVLCINKMGEEIVALTQNYQVLRLNVSPHSISVNAQETLLNSQEMLHKYSKAISVGTGFIAAPIPKTDSINITATICPSKSLSISDHTSDISATNFSSDGKYFVSGGEDGRIYLYENESFRKFLSLPNRPDYISSLKFSKDSRLLFASCFNKSNIIFDCERLKVIRIFNTNEVVEWGDFFDDNSKIYLVLRNESSVIFDIQENKITNISNPFTSWPTTFYLDCKKNLAIVGARDSTIYIINTKNNAKIFSINIDNVVGVNAILIHLNYVFIGCVDGSLFVINYKDEGGEFQKACDSKDYKKAAEMLDRNIFLSLQDCAKIFDDDWEEILKQAIELLAADKLEEASELVEPFLRDLSKKEAFSFYLGKKDIINRFQDMIDRGFYDEAYNMTLQTKFLTKTTPYEHLESLWNKAFNTAKRLLEEDSANVNHAKKILEPFTRTPKKEIIMQIINNLNAFKDAENLVKKQAFKEYFTLTSQYAYLQQTDLYKKVLTLGQNFFEKAIDFERTQNYDEFYRVAKFLQGFPMHKDNITERIIRVDKKLEMLSYIHQNNRPAAYKLASEFEELQNLPEFKAICAEFDGIYKLGLDAAFKGDLSEIGKLFSSYVGIEYWYHKIMSVYKIAYITEFKDSFSFNQHAFNWEESVKRYVEIFGEDEEISAFYKGNNIPFEPNENTEGKQPFRFQSSLLAKV